MFCYRIPTKSRLESSIKKFKPPFFFCLWLFLFSSLNDGVPINEVQSGGQADVVGFEKAMIIISINGVDVRGFSKEEAEEQLRAADVLELEVDSELVPSLPPVKRMPEHSGELDRAGGASMGFAILSASGGYKLYHRYPLVQTGVSFSAQHRDLRCGLHPASCTLHPAPSGYYRI